MPIPAVNLPPPPSLQLLRLLRILRLITLMRVSATLGKSNQRNFIQVRQYSVLRGRDSTLYCGGGRCSAGNGAVVLRAISWGRVI